MDISALKQAGLTDGEIKVYLALLGLGSSTTGPIVDKSNISRSIIYRILERLMEKGLASYITKEKTKYFQAAEPTKIIDYISEVEKKLEANKKIIEEIMPQLMLKKGTAKESEVNVYIGFKGIRTAHEHTYLKLKKGEEYSYLGIPAYQPKEQHIYWQKDHARRAKAGIRCRLLFNKGTDSKILKNRNSYKGGDARIMPSDIITPSSFLIYKDTTLIIMQSPNAIAIEIINQGITDSFKAYFDEYWKKTKRFDSNLSLPQDVSYQAQKHKLPLHL